MHQFPIHIRSFGDVKAFIALATVQPFQITVRHEDQQVNAKSFIGMMCLDYSKPICVYCECCDADFQSFQKQAARFIA
ncbi:MAG: HPr family phosphocarrier protein [Oscillospiraceae bacterium]|nr:HPr family phosphocarrier protein [Oscillospiraceae bacterium]